MDWTGNNGDMFNAGRIKSGFKAVRSQDALVVRTDPVPIYPLSRYDVFDWLLLDRCRIVIDLQWDERD